MFSYLKNIIPYRLAASAYHYLQAQRHITKEGQGYYCCGCKKYWKNFKPLPKQWILALEKSGWPFCMSDAETLNYKNYTCYGCGITDRDRLYLLFLEKILDKKKSYKIVEFAPRPALSAYLKSMPNVLHRTSDLFMNNVDDKMDIQDLYLYKDESFDVFICSHILEHVTDDIKAMKELYRILKQRAFGIAMVPIIKPVTITREDITITDKSLRQKYFGQADHVRLYAKQDFLLRLQSVGFKINQYGVDYFGEAVFKKAGITAESILYVVEK